MSKSANIKIAPVLRKAAEDVLTEDETLSAFVEQSVRESIERRHARQEFLARGLASRDKALKSGKYVSSSAVIDRLERMLANVQVSGGKGLDEFAP